MSSKLDKSSYSLIDFFEGDDYSESERYHEYTKLNRNNVALISRRVEEIKKDPGLLAMMSRSWKSYPGARTIELPEFEVPGCTLADAFMHRRSVSSLGRNFVDGPITLEQLSGTLRLACGPSAMLTTSSKDVQHLRTTSSAGALYPTEIYVVATKVDGLEPGLYHFRPIEHALEVIRPGDLRDDLAGRTSYPEMASAAPVALVMTSVVKRTLSKYQHRGYRFALYDCGALTQSLYLAGTAMQLDTCVLGGIYDDEIAEFVGVSPVDEPPQLVFLLGADGGRELHDSRFEGVGP